MGVCLLQPAGGRGGGGGTKGAEEGSTNTLSGAPVAGKTNAVFSTPHLRYGRHTRAVSWVMVCASGMVSVLTTRAEESIRVNALDRPRPKKRSSYCHGQQSRAESRAAAEPRWHWVKAELCDVVQAQTECIPLVLHTRT